MSKCRLARSPQSWFLTAMWSAYLPPCLTYSPLRDCAVSSEQAATVWCYLTCLLSCGNMLSTHFCSVGFLDAARSMHWRDVFSYVLFCVCFMLTRPSGMPLVFFFRFLLHLSKILFLLACLGNALCSPAPWHIFIFTPYAYQNT